MSEISSYEIEFLPVGNGERSGDAIAVRWLEGSAYKVMVYDGGTQESGEALVSHIKQYYNTNRVDYLVCSHPDSDHASGLSVVLEQLTVSEVWLHRPWAYSATILNYFHDGRITDASLAERLKEKMAAAHAIEEIALARGINVQEPYQGSRVGPFTVLSPAKDWYVHELIQAFEKTPKAKSEAVQTLDIAGLLKEAISSVMKWVAETWSTESLREDVTTSAENLSSVVLHATFAGKSVLLTGDAGVETLHRALDYAAALKLDLPKNLAFAQVPHHGSRNNVSSSVLDRLLGARKSENDGDYTKTAFVSAGKQSTTHPRKMVVNAFARRGAKVFATKGQTKRHHRNMPPREGWEPAEAEKFSNQVEVWND
jgi:beta-lactamase superfamily II metal-dependent hydrolase